MENDPIAFFITWTCYGTWLPGDDRGWTKWRKGEQLPQPLLNDWCRDQMSEKSILLTLVQRALVEHVVQEHCQIRGWYLHAVNCRTNHCHVVVTAIDYNGQQVRDQLKSWGKRRLKLQQKETEPEQKTRGHWWTRNGSIRHLFDSESLEAAIQYTNDAQELGGSKMNTRHR